jgi:hypothetical protein
MPYQGIPDAEFENSDCRVKHIAVRFFKEPGTGTSAGKINRWFFYTGRKRYECRGRVFAISLERSGRCMENGPENLHFIQ